MSIVEALHAEHKARLARIATKAYRPPSKPVVTAAPRIVRAPVVRAKFDPAEELAWMITIEGFEPALPDKNKPLRVIMRAVCEHQGVTVDEIASTCKIASLVHARHIFAYLARRLTNRSFPDIGKFLGGRDHSTQVYAIRKVEGMLDKDIQLRASIEMLTEKLGGEPV